MWDRFSSGSAARVRRWCLFLLATVALAGPTTWSGWAQPPEPAPDEAAQAGPTPLPAAESADADGAAAGGEGPVAEDAQRIPGIKPFELIVQGGWFMLPIGLMSVLVVTFTVERAIGLRRGRVLPSALVTNLGKLGGPRGGFDPRTAYRLCQQYPSAAASVIRAMLLKVGRPHSEVEHTVKEASEREAERLYANVRWLTLAAAVAPLLGLLGTVWGMIEAFHDTTMLAPGQDKAEELARGIYTALVTTLGGLVVAIPAAICAHYFEGRIQTLFREIDELLFNLMPQIERFEGRVRFSRQSGGPDEPVVSETRETSSTPG